MSGEPPGTRTIADPFARFVKPLLMQRLRAIGLDVEYHRGRGDSLWYTNASGEQVEVLDLVGGFGAALFGHNHPVLVERATGVLERERPFHAQASRRAATGRLGQRLCSQAERATGRAFVAHFANSGAEAVEAAIKHAEMERRGRVDRALSDLSGRQHLIRRRLREGTATFTAELFDRAAKLFGLAQIDSVDELLMRLYHRAVAELDRPPAFLAVEGAFHGKTSGSLKLTYRPEYQAPWRSLGPTSAFLPVGDTAALERAIERATLGWIDVDIDASGSIELSPRQLVNIAACFVEPIQGEGGVRPIDPAWLAQLRAAADRGGFPLVLDEIQSGMGRTGRFFASEHDGVAGDYYLLSKALGGGLAKISAVLVAKDRYLDEFGYLHTSTFADDDFSSEVALAALDLLEQDGGALMERARASGEHLLARLRRIQADHPDQLAEVRGRGLMIGIELGDQARSPSALMRVLGQQELLGFMVSGWFLHEHRIRVAPTLSARATIRVEPSAFIDARALDRFAGALDELCGLLARGDGYRLVRFLVDRAGEPDPRGEPAPRAEPDPDVRTHPAGSIPTARPAHRRSPSANPDVTPVLAATSGATRVAFLTHFLAAADVLDWDPTLAPLSPGDCERILGTTRGMVEPFIAARTQLRSALGSQAFATIIGLPFTPGQVVAAMRAGGGEWARALIDQGVELARRSGCAVVGFGGFTSILTNNCRRVAASDVALTSGNSLTAAAALEATRLATRRLGLTRRVLGVVGAAGNIGRVLAEVASDWADELVLVGRPGAERRLQGAAAAVYATAARQSGGGAPPAGLARTLESHGLLAPGAGERADAGEWLRRRAEDALGPAAPVRIATDLSALTGCDVILTASNAARPVVLPEHVAADRPVVVCDVAVPRDADPRVAIERPRAAVLAGGVVRAPLGQELRIDGMNLPPGEIYGCLAETLLMGLAGIGENFSYGALDPMRIRRIRDLALMHGFVLGENPDPSPGVDHA